MPVHAHERFANLLIKLAAASFLLFILVLCVGNILYSYKLDPAHYESQHILEMDENEGDLSGLVSLC